VNDFLQPGVVENIMQSCWKFYPLFSSEEFWKLANIWESYCQKFGGFLFWNTVYV